MTRAMKWLASESKNSFAEKIKNGDGSYKWAVYADDVDLENPELLEPQKLWDKADLTMFNGKIRKKSDIEAEWDHVVIDGITGTKEEINEQVKIILDSFAKPNFTYEKPQTGGKFTLNNVRGERQVAFTLHDEGSHGVHLHLKVFRWSKDTLNFGASPAPLSEMRVAQAQLEYTNEKLGEKVLPLIPMALMASGTNQYAKPNQETKVEAKQIVIDRIPVEEILNNIRINPDDQEKSLEKAINQEEKELANLIQAVKNKQMEISAKQEALQAVSDNKILAKTIERQEKTIQQKNDLISEKEVEIETVKEAFVEEIAELEDKFKSIVFTKEEEILEHKSKITELNEELEAVIEDRDNAYKENEIKDQLLKDTSELLELSKEEAKQQKEFSEQYKELVNSQKEQIESFKLFQQQQQEQIKEQQEILKSQQEQLLKQNEEFKKQAEEFAKLQEQSKLQTVEIEKLASDNKALHDTNNKLTGIIKQFSDVTAKMKNSYNEFVVNVKEKLKASPVVRKNFNEIFSGVEKKQENLYKEVSKVAHQAESEQIAINKDLIQSSIKTVVKEDKPDNDLPKIK